MLTRCVGCKKSYAANRKSCPKCGVKNLFPVKPR